ncbi:hypothetical protein ANCCEY_01540 [Ancylostoma ceylanicum]|uniref:Uncharacterized protein n=1 Tax=Ancylostoma ceylanicum TaxID=53326 RepID=A0A0D6MA42_9BILA|nr:hypothetical protein ANCCEY_01540 [Ancylostoma ceylanicum]
MLVISVDPYRKAQLLRANKTPCSFISLHSPGQKIRFQLTYVYFKCAPTCEEFVEVKYEESLDRTGFRQCCRAEYDEIVSSGNSILILTHATENSQFVLRYRMVVRLCKHKYVTSKDALQVQTLETRGIHITEVVCNPPGAAKTINYQTEIGVRAPRDEFVKSALL